MYIVWIKLWILPLCSTQIFMFFGNHSFFACFQEELVEVFEGSCALIPIKLIADECKNLVDEFVPELVETLSSEMNPDTVCTVAGKTESMLNLGLD